MRLGINLGTGGPGGPADDVQLAVAAERLGYSVCWAAEAYGWDCVSLLAWVGARTERIAVGSAVMQVPARSAAATAMTAATLDTLSGGRFLLGLGVSGPQVSEGWHGVRFDDPLGRTREYVDVVRRALRRETVAVQGRHVRLPLPDGPGKALRLAAHPLRPRVPIYLAALGPRNLELAGEIADGWLGVLFDPQACAPTLEALRRGRRHAVPAGAAAAAGADAAPGAGAAPAAAPDPLAGFDVAVTVPVSVAPDVATAATAVRPHVARYVGGMGSRDRNVYAAHLARTGHGSQAERVQDLYLSGRRDEAAAALELDLLDATSLLGPPERLPHRLQAFAAAGVTTLAVQPLGRDLAERTETLRTVSRAAATAGLAA